MFAIERSTVGQRSEIEEAFLSAAVEPERWLTALELLAEATGSDHAQIIGIGQGYSLSFNWVSGLQPSALLPFNNAELISPKTNFRVAAGVVAQRYAVIAEDRYEALTPSLANHAYLDLCSDLHIPYGCQTNLRLDDDGLIGLALLRSQRTGRTSPEAQALFVDVTAAAASAVSLQVAIERDGHRLVAGSFDAMGTACFVLDRTMTVRALTAPAETQLHEGAVRLHDGRVSLSNAADDRRLGMALSSVFEGGARAASIAVSDGAGVMMLRLFRLPAREWNMGFAPFAILIVKRTSGAGTLDLRLLRDTYGLTATEAEIALLLRAGQTRGAICSTRGITRETLRSHLRALFAKLGVSRETEAIHLLHALLN